MPLRQHSFLFWGDGVENTTLGRRGEVCRVELGQDNLEEIQKYRLES